MKAASRCQCGGQMVVVQDFESGLPRIKCSSPHHSPLEDLLVATREVEAANGTIHKGVALCTLCKLRQPELACNCGAVLCGMCWKIHAAKCSQAS